MIRLLLAADGERDAAIVPPLVRRMLTAQVTAQFRAWHTLRVGGDARKLRFLIRDARDQRLCGLVAVVDRDRHAKGARLRRLREGREADRIHYPPFPTALGEADPHVEAWLIDDEKAVRQALKLSPDHPVRIRPRDPKSELGKLIDASELEFESILVPLAEIARALDPTRCTHARKTGFEAFVSDVKTELGTLVEHAPPD
jgi:hypothetical protein